MPLRNLSRGLFDIDLHFLLVVQRWCAATVTAVTINTSTAGSSNKILRGVWVGMPNVVLANTFD